MAIFCHHIAQKTIHQQDNASPHALACKSCKVLDAFPDHRSISDQTTVKRVWEGNGRNLCHAQWTNCSL
ncbi:hypothetical protein TNCV_4493821 [Trichonephila clavipes]|nr:hypothetical protein TNCV_4493821 [Trichonephila clavipes]